MQRTALQSGVAVAICCLLALSVMAGITAAPAAGHDGHNPCVGTMERPATGSTLVTMQGVRFTGGEFRKRPAMLVSFGPRGGLEYAWNGSARGRWYAYDVDPLANGNLLIASTEPGTTVVQELNPREGANEWVKRFDGHNGATPGYHPQNVTDAHDVDLINGDELLIADKGTGHHRLLVYDMGEERVTWQWNFSDHREQFPRSGGGEYSRDWTHVNDVDKIGPGTYMASVRNFDQVIVVDRASGDIERTLGADDQHRFMNEQHNPQYLETKWGNSSIIVADSLNDRVVEWERRDGEWTKVWSLVGGGLDEPRDADRLPNGNTLVVDRKGHRTMEVTPEGRVVWEVYTPWQPYDAERYAIGDEPGGPAAADIGTTGRQTLHNSAGFSRSEIEACGQELAEFAPQDQLVGTKVLTGSFVDHSNRTATPTGGPGESVTETPGISTGGAGLGLVVALVAVVLVGGLVVWRYNDYSS